MSTAGFSAFLARKNIKPSAKLYFVDAMSAMAMGLFASLLIGTILDTLGDQFHWDWLVTAAGYASSATGIAIAVAIGVSLSAPPLVLYSLCAVGLGSYSVGGPLGAFFAVIVAAELGKAVSRETKIDILVTPTVTILSGLGIGTLIGPGVSLLMNGFGQLIIRATQLRPFLMGIIVSVLVGIVLTLPISSAAICFTLTLTGLAGGAATAGCCAQMIGFAVMSFAENGWGGLVAQGLGTSMLQMGNIVKNPKITPVQFNALVERNQGNEFISTLLREYAAAHAETLGDVTLPVTVEGRIMNCEKYLSIVNDAVRDPYTIRAGLVLNGICDPEY